jgi:hypothetical protein
MAGAVAAGAVTAQAGTVRLATAADDAGLRALLRRSVVPGAVRVAFTREPSYEAGAGVADADDATVLFERDGGVVAMGRCSTRAVYRNGVVRRIGYLAELRADPAARVSGRALREGFGRLAERAAQAGAEGFVTSIADDNTRARRVLGQGGRLGLPHYRPLCGLVTYLVPVAARCAGAERADASATGDELREFLAHHARDAQLTLPWSQRCWSSLARHGVTPEDFVVLRRKGRIVAAAAVWDQRAFRQAVIDGLTGPFRFVQPFVNGWHRLRGLPPLPRVGEVVPQGALLGASLDDTRDWPALWRALQSHAAARGLSWLTLALDRRDPACAQLQRLIQPREYFTTLYEVTWHDGPVWADSWDTRLMRPEVGLL